MNNNQPNNDNTVDQANMRATYEDMQKMLSLHIWKNNHLREEILNNPKQTIERDLKVKFDDHLKINVVNHTDPNEVTFILPYNIKKDNTDLSDDQLEAIAGGNLVGDMIGGIVRLAGGNHNDQQTAKTVGDAIGSTAGTIASLTGFSEANIVRSVLLKN